MMIIQVACADAYRHGPTDIVFPDRVATLEKEANVTDYETKHPGLGVSVGYNGPGITVTVYIYTMGIKTIPADLQSSILKDNFNQACGDIVRAEQKGKYSNLKKISDSEAAWGAGGTGTKSLHASWSLKWENRQYRLSHLYLLGFQNHFLKIRFTYDKDIQATAEKTQKEFLAEFSRILGAIGK